MDKSTPIGIGVGLALVFIPIFLGTGAGAFFDIPSILMVLGGTIAALLVNYTVDDLKKMVAGIKGFFGFQPPELTQYVRSFTEMARLARREGLLALDKQLEQVEDDLTRFGLEMAVDGTDPKEIDAFMEQRINDALKEHKLLAKMLNSAGTFAPSFGMIGTLVGLIQMMQNLTDPAAIGAGMAIAMITTFYGALFANLFFLPMASKMGERVKLVEASGEIVRIGIIAIVRGDNPSVVEKRLSMYAGVKAGEEKEEGTEAPLAQAA